MLVADGCRGVQTVSGGMTQRSVRFQNVEAEVNFLLLFRMDHMLEALLFIMLL